jgi:hypothetical protein
MVQIIDSLIRRWVNGQLANTVAIDIGPVSIMATAAVAGRCRNTFVTGSTVNAVRHRGVMMIGPGICHPGCCSVTRFAALNNREAGMTLRTVATLEDR